MSLRESRRTTSVRTKSAQCQSALNSNVVNAGFMREGQLLEKAEIDKIRHIPATIIQGRYDSVCPAKTAWDLHKGTSAPVAVLPEANDCFVSVKHGPKRSS